VNEALLLLVILAAIYLIECVAWGPAAPFAFRARPRRPWTRATEVIAVFDDQRRAVFGGVVPGTGGIAWTESRPPALSPSGICACATRAGVAGIPLTYETLRDVHAEGRAVRSGSRTLLRVATSAYARQVAELIRELASLGPEARAGRIEAEIADVLEPRRARRALRRYEWWTRGLIVPERILAVAMLMLPAALLRGGILGAWPEAALTFALGMYVVVTFAARLRRLRVAARRRNSRGAGSALGFSISDHVTSMLLGPPVAIRADDIAAREMFGGLHAVGVARVACEANVSASLAATTLRELTNPLESERADCCTASEWSRRAWRRAFEAWAVREFGGLELLLAPPARESERVVAHCPRCHVQFTHGEGECPGCPGVSLVAFERAEPSGRRLQA